MSTNNAGLVKVNGCGDIYPNNEAVNNFTFFYLPMSHIHSKRMCNQIEINYHMVKLSSMQYIHLL